MQVDFGRFRIPVSEQGLDHTGVNPCLHKMGRKAVGSGACRKPRFSDTAAHDLYFKSSVESRSPSISCLDRTVGSLWSMRMRGTLTSSQRICRSFAHIVQKIGYIVFITENGTVFKVPDFCFFFEKQHIFFVHIGSSIKSDSQQLRNIFLWRGICKIKVLANTAGGCYSYHKQWSGICPYSKYVLVALKQYYLGTFLSTVFRKRKAAP